MDSKLAVKQLNALKKLIKGKELRLAAEWPKKWQILIATILSAVTRDEKTIEVCEILFKKYPTPKKLSDASIKDIKRVIRQINYHKTKARHIKETCMIISKDKIPNTLEGLLELPGVGRKVGNVYLAVAHESDSIGVDTHITRISRKLGWTKNKHPHKIEKDLEKLFPKKYWRHINYIVVTFGRTIGRNRAEEDRVLAKLI